MRIDSLNTWKNDGAYDDRLAAMAEQLADTAADVLCLQECFRTRDGSTDTAAYLAESLAMSCCYLGARRKFRRWRDAGAPAVDSESGLAVLSRTPGFQHRAIPLPQHPNDDERLAQVVEIGQGATRVLIVNSHLCHVRAATAWRARQMQTILDHPLVQRTSPLTVVAGDFNDTPTSPALQALTGCRRFHVVTCCDLLPRSTRDAGSLLPPTAADARWIDYVALLAPRSGPPVRGIRAGTIADRYDSQRATWPSDHRGVLLVDDRIASPRAEHRHTTG